MNLLHTELLAAARRYLVNTLQKNFPCVKNTGGNQIIAKNFVIILSNKEIQHSGIYKNKTNSTIRKIFNIHVHITTTLTYCIL